MKQWNVITRFATRINAEGFITEQRARKNAKYHNSPLLLVCDPEVKDGFYWLIITK